MAKKATKRADAPAAAPPPPPAPVAGLEPVTDPVALAWAGIVGVDPGAPPAAPDVVPAVPPGVPDTLGGCADLLYDLRSERLALESRADEVKKREGAVRDHLQRQLEDQGASGVAGERAKVSLNQTQIGRISDFDALLTHVVQSGDLDLLQRRVNDGALRARWEAGQAVPGVQPFPITKVSVVKR